MLNIPPGINHDEALENEARRLERERIIEVLLSFPDPDEFRDYIDNDLCGIPCWHEEKLRAALEPRS